jgi:hypothetical protein
MDFFNETRKAWVSLLLAILTPLSVLLLSSVELTPRNVTASIVAGLVVGLGVFVTPNASKTEGV